MSELVELTLAPSRPFPCPETLDGDAWPALAAMIAESGPTVFHTPTSCDFLMKQHLAAFPRERELLSLALHRGVPATIAKDEQPGPVAPLLARLADQFAAATDTPPHEATWAVHAWASAVGRPPYSVVGATRPVPKPPADAVVVAATTERAVMSGIAGLGGALGGLLGNGAVQMALYAVFSAVDAVHAVKSSDRDDARTISVLVLTMAAGAIMGGIGGAAGWWLGRGDERPWAGFAAACGAAFGTGCLAMMLRGPNLGTATAMGLAALGATYACASRGGLKS